MLALVIGLGAARSSTAADVARAPQTSGAVVVVKVSGLLDPILADFVAGSIDQAVETGAIAVVLRIDSPGSVISDGRLADLAEKIHDAPIPVVAWVGPSGARVEGATAQLLAVVDEVGIAPGSAIGNMGETVVPRRLWSDAYWQHRAILQDQLVGSAKAAQAGLAVPPRKSLVLRNMLLEVPGFRATAKGATSATPVQFSELSAARTALHTFASPAVTALLLAIALCLLLFEFYTAGVGVAGLVGAACLLFAFYGIGVLPVRPFAVALVVVSMIAFAVDVQVGVPRIWTAVGSVVFATGFLLLFDGVPIPWPATIGGIAAVVVFMIFGMPAMTRSRFSTPMIDRQWLVGCRGTSVGAFDPDGVVRIDGALWPGRCAQTLPADASVRVVAVDGVLCRVEPDDGA